MRSVTTLTLKNFINGRMPHGGFTYSGYGKDLSMYGVEDYTHIKHVMVFLE